MPTVSVIIPTYNRAAALPRAVDSVLGQTESDFELIVVDDGSTDRTIDVLEKYDDHRIRVVSHKSNRGASAARNTGIEHADGKFVAFLDSDDEWRPEKLERQLRVLADRSDEWVAAYCGFEIRPPGFSGTVKKKVAQVIPSNQATTGSEGGEELIGDILADNVHPGGGSTLLVRTDVATQIGGFDESLDRFQDPEFILRVLGVGKLAYIDEPLVIRHDSGQPAAELVESADNQYLEMYADTVRQLESNGFDITGSHSLLLSKLYFQEGNYQAGIRFLRRAAIEPRQTPGLIWSVGTGIRNRPKPALVLLLGVLVVMWAYRTVR